MDEITENVYDEAAVDEEDEPVHSDDEDEAYIGLVVELPDDDDEDYKDHEDRGMDDYDDDDDENGAEDSNDDYDEDSADDDDDDGVLYTRTPRKSNLPKAVQDGRKKRANVVTTTPLKSASKLKRVTGVVEQDAETTTPVTSPRARTKPTSKPRAKRVSNSATKHASTGTTSSSKTSVVKKMMTCALQPAEWNAKQVLMAMNTRVSTTTMYDIDV